MMINLQEDDKFNVGDLVEIVHIGDGTAYFPWAEAPVSGIYMGSSEFTFYLDNNSKKTDYCYKIWSMGKMRYVENHEPIRLLSRA